MTAIKWLVKPSDNIVYDIKPNQSSISIPIKDIVNRIVRNTGYAVTFRGVDNVTTYDPRYVGSKLDQLIKLKNEANLNMVIGHNSLLVTSKKTRSTKRSCLYYKWQLK